MAEIDVSESLSNVLKVIIRHVEERGFQPTLGEIAKELGVCRNTVKNRLVQLGKMGFVEYPPVGRDRAIRLCQVRFRAVAIPREVER